MSLWTPSGEHQVGRDQGPGGDRPGAPPRRPGEPSSAPTSAPGTEESATETAAQLNELRRQLAEAPAEVVVANHAYGLFELAAVYLSQAPPELDRARLAIDAMASLVEGLGDRLGEAHASLKDALAQVRLAYVQLDTAERARSTQEGGEGNGNAGVS